MLELLEKRLLLSRTWFVAPNGAATNPGTITQPLRTIQQAASLAQPGDTVYIRAGTYHETVTPANSGTATAPITYTAYDNESVTIDGADPINGWTSVAGSRKIYSAPMPWTLGEGNDEIFVNGKEMNEAEWPNTAIGAVQPATATISSLYTSALGTGNSFSDTATISVSGLPGGTAAWVGSTIHFGAGQGWVIQTGTVVAAGNGTITFAYQHDGSYETPVVGNHFYLTGKYAGLDAAGTWYRNSNGTLYLEPTSGSIPAANSVEAKSRQYAFELSGRGYIDISGIHIIAASIDTNSASSHINIGNITASYIAEHMVNPIGWIGDTPTTGILLMGPNDVLQSSTISYSSGNGVYLGGSNDIVENCTIADTDYSGTDQAAITIVGSGNQALSNYIHDTGRDGILDSNAVAARIEYNTITAIGHQDTDLGAIYDFGTNSQGTEIAYNKISNISTGGYGGDGVYLDNGSSNYRVFDNTITNVQIPLHLNLPSYNNSVTDNTINGKLVANSSSTNTPATSAAVYHGSQAVLSVLGTLGGFRSESYGINDSGQVAGTSMANTSRPAFLDSGTTMTAINPFGSASSQANAINSSAEIAGSAVISNGMPIAFTALNGRVTSLGTLPGDVGSMANAINDNGQVAGVSFGTNAVGHAFVSSGGSLIALGTLGGSMSAAFGIDNAGTVVGASTLPGDRDAHAFVWYNGTMNDLGTLGGSSSYALAINNSHQIVGTSLVAGNHAFHAFIDQNGHMQDLGTLAGYSNSVATGIDSAGDVVGYCYNTDIGARRAFLYRDGKMIDLNTLIPANTDCVLTQATGINDNNQITGIANASNSRERGFILSIVG